MELLEVHPGSRQILRVPAAVAEDGEALCRDVDAEGRHVRDNYGDVFSSAARTFLHQCHVAFNTIHTYLNINSLSAHVSRVTCHVSRPSQHHLGDIGHVVQRLHALLHKSYIVTSYADL